MRGPLMFPKGGERRPNGLPIALAAGVIVLFALVAFWNSFSGPFIFDDLDSIKDNSTIRHLWPPLEALSPPTNSGITVSGRPVLNLSFAINYALHGSALWGYHLGNLLLHILAGLVLFGLLRRTLISQSLSEEFGAHSVPLSALIAVLWVVHPLQTESVTYLVQRAESLSGLFYLLTLYGFVRSVSESRTPAFWLLLSWLACVLGMGTKEIMVSAPAVVLLYDRTFVSGSFSAALRQRLAYYLSLTLTWIVLAWLVIQTGNRGGTAGFGIGTSWYSYALTQCHAVFMYLKLTFWPHPLTLDYGETLIHDILQVIPEAAVLLLLGGASLVALWRRPALGFAACWFFIMLAPTSSVLPVATQTMAEHRIYLALAGVLSVFTLVSYHYLGRRSPWIFFGLFSLVSLIETFLTVRRNDDYRTDMAIWKDTYEKRPSNLRARNNLGIAFLSEGEIEQARAHFEEILRIRPSYAEARYNLGLVYLEMGRPSVAIEHFEEALRLKPDYVSAYNHMGLALMKAGQERAIDYFWRALTIRPDKAESHYNLGLALLRSGQPADAIKPFEEAIRLDPEDAEAVCNLGLAHARLGQWEKAITLYLDALHLNPDYPEACNNLGIAYAEVGRKQDAKMQFKRALQLRPEYPEASANLERVLGM